MTKINTTQNNFTQSASSFISFSLNELGPRLDSLLEQFIQNECESDEDVRNATQTMIEQYCLGWDLKWYQLGSDIYIFSPYRVDLGLVKIDLWEPLNGLYEDSDRIYLMSAFSNPNGFKNHKNLSYFEKKFFHTEDNQYQLPLTIKYPESSESKLLISSPNHYDLHLLIVGLNQTGKVRLEENPTDGTLHVVVTEPTFSITSGFDEICAKYFQPDVKWRFVD